ncbi:MAG: hypothetical protein Kilf2KO_32020 [Rhodospirillales bacterium]
MSEESESAQSWRSFDAVYDRDEPRAYFRALAPLGYRQPDVVAGFLAERGRAVAQARGQRRLRILDFGCGYGALGAVISHRLLMEDLFAYFTAPGGAQSDDRTFFAERRKTAPGPLIGGLDIAGRAVAYAQACGLIEAGFTENLTQTAPGPALQAFFAETDLVVETGAVYDHVPACYRRLLESSAQRPWLLFGPRGDVDTAPLWSLLEEAGYGLETVSQGHRRYRRFLDGDERAASEAAMRTFGRDPARCSGQGWFLNPLVLARPRADRDALPIEALRY